MSFQKGAAYSIVREEKFERKAAEALPKLYERTVTPKRMVATAQDPNALHGWKVVEKEAGKTSYGKGDEVIFDFGEHLVGYVSLHIEPEGSPPDAPAHLEFMFGEMPVEVSEPPGTYDGWISSSWLQQAREHIDVLPWKLELKRRYSFRYLKIRVLDTSQKFTVSFHDVTCTAVTSADRHAVPARSWEGELLQELDEVSLRTLENCMQEVFEDGPKRDRRLWLGDLRLQALANYVTFGANDLVKRNLYQFAAVPNEEGRVAANLFMKPKLIPDDTYLFDYALFFATTLHDYYEYTNDKETLQELWPTAYRQLEVGLERVEENGIVRDDESWWSFIDWQKGLNKQAASQAILVYALRKGAVMAEALGKTEQAVILQLQAEAASQAAKAQLWDDEAGFYVSGEEKQISWASQVWMVYAGVLDKKEAKQLLQRLRETPPQIGMNTPYMHHHYAEALCLYGELEEALAHMRWYWGGMLEDGADTFWELYQPEDKTFSPYGNFLINSYCHAWSCTPTYLLRKYF
ncbi:family 78 glycoside hydrolase catalytic domain [Alkalicoccus daliensis]|uniref:Alpha-L-rhamnosidase n=1 Tax=Alkalicoccus daliensis TaxID=745820 RepID=A0A1H0F277_9BACI|nr:family 78 glycoside hydrolase catalytic domain [Alkalicoccus daliensis]SDN88744.1 alpha-L-rhamnosidase [Alkalicoccus daliensis]